MLATRILIRRSLILVSAAGAVYFLCSGYIKPLIAGWPLTVDAASDKVMAQLSDEQKAELRATSKENLNNYHFGLGMTIRNQFGLWQGNWALLESACDTPCQPDDASAVIIERTWEKLRSQQSH